MQKDGTEKNTVKPRVVLVSLYGIENRGVRYISAMLRRNGFEPHLILLKRWVNNQISGPTEKEENIFRDVIREINPAVVGFGFGAPYFKIAARLSSLLRQDSKALILWGGIFPTVCPEDCIEHADVVCVGEGEYPVLDMCRALEEGRDISSVPNLWVKKGGSIVKNEPRELMQDLDALPFPEYLQPGTCFIEDDKLRRIDPIGETAEYRIYPTRGCPYACAYCNNSVLRNIFKNKGRYYRFRSAKNVIDELEIAMKILPRTRRIKFDGDVFAFPKDWIETFCQDYSARIGIPFEILSYPGELDEKDLIALKKAGLCKIQAGIQSASEHEVKDTYGRDSTVKDIHELTRLAHKTGIEVVFDIIFDNPLATSADKKAMVEMLLELERPFLIYIYSLTVFPKTAVATELLSRGLITPDDVEGRATKSFRQFRLSLDYPRSREDIFWISLVILSSKSFVPKALVRRLMNSRRLMENPWPLKAAAQAADIAKAAFLALKMLFNGELTMFKIRQYGSFKKVISQ